VLLWLVKIWHDLAESAASEPAGTWRAACRLATLAEKAAALISEASCTM